MDINATEITEILEGKAVKFSERTTFSRVVIDSREAVSGSLFVALLGENVDGHDFVNDAAERGADVALVNREVDAEIGQIVVADTGIALLALAGYRRTLFEGKTIAITGSCGKTTTKDMLVSILSQRYKVHGPPGNYNTELGVPLTILDMPDDADVLVLELGVSAIGDMNVLGVITYPDVAVFTCIGPTHTEFLGNVMGVAREKARLLEFVSPGGTAILNADDEMVMEMADKLSDEVAYKSFGIIDTADTFASDVVDEGLRGIRFKLDGEIACRIPLPGEYNLYNALAASAAAKELGMEREGIIAAYADFKPGDMRSQVREIDGVTYIIDCYNSSPRAARAALDTLVASKREGKTFAVLGEMRELGDISDAEHRALGRYAAELGIDHIVGFAEGGRKIAGGAGEAGYSGKAVSFDTYDAVSGYLNANLAVNDTILFKASRGVELENVPRSMGIIE
ncbi:MAG: UDP-N-acetylmuramoyl-tripeptide--D-alanyl-D-alanine ligase [bacterium]|nr:UDP-N-acetylmuramoyl-tripeptide--D-alanyl-D-alanine ligase [bacterium]